MKTTKDSQRPSGKHKGHDPLDALFERTGAKVVDYSTPEIYARLIGDPPIVLLAFVVTTPAKEVDQIISRIKKSMRSTVGADGVEKYRMAWKAILEADDKALAQIIETNTDSRRKSEFAPHIEKQIRSAADHLVTKRFSPENIRRDLDWYFGIFPERRPRDLSIERYIQEEKNRKGGNRKRGTTYRRRASLPKEAFAFIKAKCETMRKTNGRIDYDELDRMYDDERRAAEARGEQWPPLQGEHLKRIAQAKNFQAYLNYRRHR